MLVLKGSVRNLLVYKSTSSVNITVSSASLPLTGEERAGNVHGDRPAPSGLSRRRQGDAREQRDLKDRCLSRIAAGFFFFFFTATSGAHKSSTKALNVCVCR